jgi:methylmalonyl-CoA/ethylmalonyl-CoA epimerase
VSVRLDHVAIAVRTIADRLPFYRDLLGLEVTAIEEVEGEGVRVAILGEGAGRVELLEPTITDSPVDRFVKAKGEGLHHLCFRVDSVEASCRRFEAAGFRPAGGIRSGSEGSRIAFLHPRDTGGVLIELRESPAGGPGGERERKS